jgi:hypothetical protein
MKIIVLYIVLFTSNIISQNLNTEFKYLAEYAIIKNKLTFYENKSDWSFYPHPEDTTNNLGPLNKNMNFTFNVYEIFKINDVRIIKIEDLIYPYFTSVYAVKQEDSAKPFLFQREIKYGEEEEFTNFLLQDLQKKRNIDKKVFIELYNLLIELDKEVIFLNETNTGDFVLLKDYRLDDCNKLYKSDGSYYYDSFFKIKDANTVSFYFIKYIFSYDNFSVDKVLLYKVKV